jgi:hypothetical protein
LNSEKPDSSKAIKERRDAVVKKLPLMFIIKEFKLEEKIKHVNQRF